MTELTEEQADPWHISLLNYWHISWKDVREHMRFKMDREMVQMHAPDF